MLGDYEDVGSLMSVMNSSSPSTLVDEKKVCGNACLILLCFLWAECVEGKLALGKELICLMNLH